MKISILRNIIQHSVAPPFAAIHDSPTGNRRQSGTRDESQETGKTQSENRLITCRCFSDVCSNRKLVLMACKMLRRSSSDLGTTWSSTLYDSSSAPAIEVRGNGWAYANPTKEGQNRNAGTRIGTGPVQEHMAIITTGVLPGLATRQRDVRRILTRGIDQLCATTLSPLAVGCRAPTVGDFYIFPQSNCIP